MKRKFARLGAVFLSIYLLTQPANAATLLIPGGQVIGMHLQDETVTVTDFDPTLGQAAKSAGLQTGDRLVALNGSPIHSVEDLQALLQKTDGTVKLTVRRSGKLKHLTLRPAITEDGPKLGVYLRAGTTGLGTVTYYTAQGEYGALGHGVNDAAGKLLEINGGEIYAARVTGVKKGAIGTPGQLLGSVTSQAPLAKLEKNTAQGVFGGDLENKATALPAAEKSEIKTGSATIRATVSDAAPREYSVEILKIYPNTAAKTRNFLLKVTDPALLSTTGGIVQGMSGSPLVQDGKLIGAVTHVLVNDPTMGYGIFIENMLEAAG